MFVFKGTCAALWSTLRLSPVELQPAIQLEPTCSSNSCFQRLLVLLPQLHNLLLQLLHLFQLLLLCTLQLARMIGPPAEAR